MPDQQTSQGEDSAKAETTFFRPQDDLHIHRGNLPHWRQEGVTYFITTRLADSMPQEKLREWHLKRDSWLTAHGLQTHTDLHLLPAEQQHEFHGTFTGEWQTGLDAGYGECLLRVPEVRQVVIDRLWAEPSLDAWVIMPNHVHALVTPQDKSLGEVMRCWKGGSAFEINRLLGRKGPFWQKEAYDHIVRSEAQWHHYRCYIAQNPIQANLKPHEYTVGLGKRCFNVASALAELLTIPCG